MYYIFSYRHSQDYFYILIAKPEYSVFPESPAFYAHIMPFYSNTKCNTYPVQIPYDLNNAFSNPPKKHFEVSGQALHLSCQ